MEINEIKYGFKLLSIKEVEDVNIVVYEYEHLYSGAKTVYVKTDDKNSVFAIGFKTPPVDSTGVCHIIEHSLLCGSKKYPLKEPFVNLLKSSLATFLNAFTANDWTMYPCASKTPKDFDNLVSVYLDAVFNPLSVKDEKAFLQEGWHLELLNKEDDLSIKGVVYNEMKGAMSSSDEILSLATMEAMYKDTSYQYNSGGDPDVIPNLTYDMYKDYYFKHYTPENALTYFYGDFDIEEKLEMLDREYFSSYKRTDNKIEIKVQKPHINVDFEKVYPIGDDEKEENNTNFSLCYALGDHKDKEKITAFSILFNALLSKNNSPLKKALLDAKLGDNIAYNFDDANIVPALHIYLYKSNRNMKDKFRKVFVDETRKLVENGIDKKILLASINRFEFIDKELDSGRTPKGLLFMMNMMECYNFDEDIISKLEFSSHYKNLKEKLNTNYFENLLEEYILNSNHYVEVTCLPSSTLRKEKEEKLKKELKNLKDSMSKEEIEQVIKTTKELIEYQNKEDSKEDLKRIPTLSLKDIDSSITYSKVKKSRYKRFNLHEQVINTNKISYVELYFDLNKIKYEDLPYTYILENLLLNISTKKHDALSLNNEVKTYLGDLRFFKGFYSKGKEKLLPRFVVSASSLEENVEYMMKLITEILYCTKFSYKEVKRILTQRIESLRLDLIENGMNNASLEAKKHYSDASKLILKTTRGYELYNFMKELKKNYNHKEFVSKMKNIIDRLFTSNNVDVFVAGDKETIKKTKSVLKYLKLKNTASEDALIIPSTIKSNDALIIPSDVSYNVLASNLSCFDMEFDGSMFLLSQIINFNYLWLNVRVKGGAYGSSFSVLKNGEITISSYRDPNVYNTYKIFEEVGDFIRNYDLKNKELKTYIISAVGNMDAPVSTPTLISNWNVNYLIGVTPSYLAQTKKEVLKTKVTDIKKYAELFDKLKLDSCRYTVGSETRIKEYKFDNIKAL